MTYTKQKRGHRAAAWVGAVLTAGLLCLLPELGSGAQKATTKISVPDISRKLSNAVTAQEQALARMDYQGIPAAPVSQAKKLSDGDLIAPAPNPNGYGRADSLSQMTWFAEQAAPLLEGQSLYFSQVQELMEDSQVKYYVDDSIATVTWKEGYGNTALTFAEVVIADGSQFRRFLADGRYGADTQYKTTEMAQTVNAVLASSGDFYKFHYNGIIVYENTVRNVHSNKADTCFVNDEGDLLFVSQDVKMTKEEAQQFVDENHIRFSLAFGPILIENGERCEPKNYDLGEVNSFSPRAALCQMGKRHYLIVTANQEGSHSGAITIHQLAERLVETGCEKAYTLDGGQTAAIALGGELVNRVLYGQQRSISDIIYFATSVGG